MRQACTEEKKLKIKESMKATKEKRSHQVCRVFKIKIDQSKLSKRQSEQLKMMFVEGKWIKNAGISWAKENNVSIFECKPPHKHELIPVKTKSGNIEYRELKFIGSQMAQDVVADMKSNLKTIIRLTKKGFQQHGELKHVSEIKALNLRQYGLTYKFKSHKRMKIQGVSGLISISGAKQFLDNKDIEIASAKILNTPKGYYIAISTFIEKYKLEKPKSNGKSIGLDLGCETSITYSDGRKQNVKIGESERMKNLQRKLQRQVKGSNNWNKTKKLLRVEYQKINNKKNDISNKIVSELKCYDNVVIQNEQLTNWHKTGHGKAVQHSCLGRIKSKLKNMNNVLTIASNIPTTKICLNCGKVYEMDESQRIFQCTCGCNEDRDIHAAKNMMTIVSMILDNDLSVPVGRRDFKRVEFLHVYQKKFKMDYVKMMKHEAEHPLGCR